MVISADPDEHRAYIQKFVDLGFDRIYLHNVGRNQREWIEVFGREVLPEALAMSEHGAAPGGPTAARARPVRAPHGVGARGPRRGPAG